MSNDATSRHYGRWSPKKDCCSCGGPLLIWMVIDEDTAAYGGRENQGECGCYEKEDTEKLESLYGEYPLLRNTTVCNRVEANKSSASPEYRDIWQVNANPSGVKFRDWSRPPTLERIKEDFLDDIERFKNWNEKLYFYTIVDNSGSMTTSTVQPAWGQFLNWLDTEFSEQDDRFVKVHTNSSGFPERWIVFIREQMEKYVEEMQLEPEKQEAKARVFLVPENMVSNDPVMPDTHDLSAWREYHGPYCRWMHDTGVMAPGNCLSHIVECENLQCPLSQPDSSGVKPRWKTRFCNPNHCRFFEL